MDESFDFSVFDRSIDALPRQFAENPPSVAIVLGSGWSNALAPDERDVLARVSYSDVPALGASTVVGHAGELVLFRFGGRAVAAFRGRRHFYEGVGWGPVIAPVEIARRLGVKDILLTNASGGIRDGLRPGSLMAISDHVNFTGLNPLRGAQVPGWGPRFPDMSEVYDKKRRAAFCALARERGVEISEGVYVYVAGPSFETPAEIKAYRMIGADAVGMSTVPEAVLAHAMGMRVSALSCITNFAAGLADRQLNHEEVLETSRDSMPRMRTALECYLSALVPASTAAGETPVKNP